VKTRFAKLGHPPRWISPDPAGVAVADPSNPQTWNRYAYVVNNPLQFTDPTGLECFDAGDNPEDCDGGFSLAFGFDRGGGYFSGLFFDDWNDPIPWRTDGGGAYGSGGLNSVAYGIFQGENSINFPFGSLGSLVADALGIPSQSGCEFGACGPMVDRYTNPKAGLGGVDGADYTFFTVVYGFSDIIQDLFPSSAGVGKRSPYLVPGTLCSAGCHPEPPIFTDPCDGSSKCPRSSRKPRYRDRVSFGSWQL